MLLNASILSFVPVSDLNAAEQFYVRTLGLTVVEKNEFALVVANAAGQRLRCVLTPDARVQPFTVLGWEVVDLQAAARELAASHLRPILYPHFQQDADGIWISPDGTAKVLWFHDPDGNVLSLSQHAGAAK